MIFKEGKEGRRKGGREGREGGKEGEEAWKYRGGGNFNLNSY
jgi:hypothetical protein